MKQLLLLLSFLPLSLLAQNYPFDEGFTGIPTYSIPTGWSGDMRVMPDHGLNDDKGLVADISGTDRVDSAFTPWIGPLDTFTEVIFWYRMVEDFIFPSTEKHLSSKDQLALAISTDSLNWTNVYVIDSSNHVPTINFKKIVFTLTGYEGQTVIFKWRAQWGAGSSYYTDIDSIKIRKDAFPPTAITEAALNNFSVAPNPCRIADGLTITTPKAVNAIAVITDLSGREVYRQQLNGNTHMPLQGITPGMYLLQLSDDKQSATKKIILTE
ncbi:MAG: T9SS type A sorting domain-containing protein [Chitinophagales bacterium]